MSKLRLIQAGLGNFGRFWLKDIVLPSDDFELAAIVDSSPENLKEVARENDIPKKQRFTSLEEALDSVEADAVLTVTPPDVHVEHARLAFARGLHLITDKPIAGSMGDAREMVRLAEEAGLQLAVNQNYRYRSFIRAMQRMIADQAYGAFGHGHIDFYIPIDLGGGFREEMDFPLLVDMAIHHVDLIRCITGRNITAVTAHTFNPAWSWMKGHAGLKMLLELEGGLPFSYTGDWSAYGRSTTWNGSWRLQCAEASIHLEDDQITVGKCGRWDSDPAIYRIRPEPLPLTDMHATLHSFAGAIRSGQPAETSGADNLHSFGAVMAAVISTQERRTVALSEVLG